MSDGAQSASPSTPTSRRRGLSPDGSLLRRVRWRLVAWSAITTLIALLLLGGAIYFAVASALESSGREQLDQRMADVQQFLRETRLPPASAPIGLRVGGRGSGTFAFIIEPNLTSIGPPEGQNIVGLPDAEAIAVARGGRTDIRRLDVGGVPLRVLTEPVQRGTDTYVVQVVQDISAEQRILSVLLTVLLAGSLLALVAAIVAGSFFAGRALVPIRESL